MLSRWNLFRLNFVRFPCVFKNFVEWSLRGNPRACSGDTSVRLTSVCRARAWPLRFLGLFLYLTFFLPRCLLFPLPFFSSFLSILLSFSFSVWVPRRWWGVGETHPHGRYEKKEREEIFFDSWFSDQQTWTFESLRVSR